MNIEKITISNDFMFGYVMSDTKRCKAFLEQLLDIRIDHIEYLEKQKALDSRIDARSVRLDIYVQDSTTVYDCEMQTVSGAGLPKRSRYYQGQIDMILINKGESYSKLKKSLVIFICAFDPFGRDRYIYTFENICREDNSIYLKDEAEKVFINTRGTAGEVSDEFRELMEYFNDRKTAEKCRNSLVKEIDRAVEAAKNSDEWRHDYMTWQMYGNEKYEQGIEQGMQKGMQKGIEKGKTEGTLSTLWNLFNNGSISLSVAAEQAGMSEAAFLRTRHE